MSLTPKFTPNSTHGSWRVVEVRQRIEFEEERIRHLANDLVLRVDLDNNNESIYNVSGQQNMLKGAIQR